MRAATKRLAIWVSIGSVVALGLIFAFRPAPVPVDVIRLELSELVVTIDDEGQTRVRDVFVLSAPVTGKARRILLEVGDIVTMNETIVTEIEPSEPEFLNPRSEAQAQALVKAAESNLSLARAEVEQAQAELDFARKERTRARQLVAASSISERALDEAERAFRIRTAELNTARAALQVQVFELERARAALISPATTAGSPADCVCIPVTAPVSGNVLNVLHESEGIVTAGTPLAAIGDPNSIEVVVDLLSADAVKVRPGQVVVIDEWGGNIPLDGVVRRVEPFGFTRVSSLGIEEQRVNVVIDFKNTDDVDPNLGHGYRVVARIVLGHDRDVVTVPLTALFRDGDDWAVFEARGGRAHVKRVTLGRRNSLEAVVVDGLSAGTAIVAYPSDRLRSGVRIEERG